MTLASLQLEKPHGLQLSFIPLVWQLRRKVLGSPAAALVAGGRWDAIWGTQGLKFVSDSEQHNGDVGSFSLKSESQWSQGWLIVWGAWAGAAYLSKSLGPVHLISDPQ